MSKNNLMSLFTTIPQLVWVAVIIILIMFIILILTKKLKHAPNILTTLGIGFTFLGISYGLLQFNIGNGDLSKSIDCLLDGLKFSFIPSTVGILFALLSKIFVVLKSHNIPLIKNNSSEKFSISLQEFSEIFKIESRLNADKITNKFDDHTSKVSLQLVDIRRDLKEFKDEVVSNNTSALIEALQHVLEDFNTKISDHLGDNFKALNTAVQNLVTWQDNYKITIENTMNDYIILINKNRELLAIMDSSLNNVEHLNQKIYATSEHIVGLTTNIIETHNKLGNTANGISNQIELLTHHCSNMAQNMNTHAENISKTTNTIFESTSESHKGLQTNIAMFGQESKTLLQEIREAFNQQIKSMNNNIHELEDSVKKQIENLDNALETEINKSLEGLGRGLTAISEKFVDDYTPLTDKLRSLINISVV